MILLDPGEATLGFIPNKDCIFPLSMKVALAPCPMGSMIHPVWVTNTCISQTADWGPCTCFAAARQISREASSREVILRRVVLVLEPLGKILP